jgi:hypothetical protein
VCCYHLFYLAKNKELSKLLLQQLEERFPADELLEALARSVLSSLLYMPALIT